MADNSDPHASAPFDRAALLRHRNRAANAWAEYYHIHSDRGEASGEASGAPDFLLREVAGRLADRLLDINRSFERGLDLGCHGGQLGAVLEDKVNWLAQADASEAMARQARAFGPVLVADEEALPIAPQSLDLVLSCLSLHWVNDLPGALLQARQALKPDGLFLAALIGGDSLHELRQSLLRAETTVSGGVRPRIAPMLDIRDAGDLLQRAGFALPVVDVDELCFRYGDPFTLLRELRQLGEQSPLSARPRHFTRRSIFAEMAHAYHQDWAGSDGRLPATFQILYLTAWGPADSQPRPLAPGSARHSLADALDPSTSDG